MCIAPRRQGRKDFVKKLTAETQSTLREDFFAQSGDDDWAKDLVFKRGMFLFVVVSRQTKKGILCDLCASAVNKLLSAMICVNLRLIAFDALRLCARPVEYEPWSRRSNSVELLLHRASILFPNS